MKRTWKMMSAAAIAAGLSGAATAQQGFSDRVALGVYAGTVGVGGDVQVKANDFFVLRGGGHWADIGVSAEFDDIDYDADFRLSNGFVTGDIHPFRNGFLVSGGVIIGADTIDLVAQAADEIEIGGEVFTPDEVGVLTGEVSGRTAAPFAGVGFDNALTGSGRLGFSVLAGVGFTGAPEVTLISADGLLSESEELLDALAVEVEELEDDIDAFRFYPVLRVGLAYRF